MKAAARADPGSRPADRRESRPAQPTHRDRTSYEQTIDTVSKDELSPAGIDPTPPGRRPGASSRRSSSSSRENKDEITALQILYSRPTGSGYLKEIKELAETIKRPPRALDAEPLWQAYEALDRSKVRGSVAAMLTDIVSLVRFAMHQEN